MRTFGSLWSRVRLLRRPLPAQAAGAGTVRRRHQASRGAALLAGAPLDRAAARVSRLRAARADVALAPAPAARADPRLPGRRPRTSPPRTRIARARRPRSAARAAAAAESARERLGLLELVRPRDRARLGRNGDRRRADPRGAPQLPDRQQARVRRRPVVRRRARGGARRCGAPISSPACSSIRASPAARRRRRSPRSAC